MWAAATTLYYLYTVSLEYCNNFPSSIIPEGMSTMSNKYSMITFTINKTVSENWSTKVQFKQETQQLHFYILLRNSQHPNITETAAISLSVTVEITIKRSTMTAP